MNEERYDNISNNWNYEVFTFVSDGRHGKLSKIVMFRDIEIRNNTYNVALGTIYPNYIDFNSVTNNGDRNKVLATVVRVISIFLEKHPNNAAYLAGSDYRRTNLYHRAINYGYDDLIKTFNIYGEISENTLSDFEVFDKRKSYFGFLVERK